MARRIEVEILGDSKSLERAFARSEKAGKQFNRSMERAGRGAVVASVGFHGLGRAVGYASASFLGAAGFVSVVKAGFNEMLAGQAVAADTAAVLKSTGKVAGVTAKHVNTLATSMQQLTGYDDEAIQSAENLLLTFTNLRNVAGKGNDVFNQTVAATLDLSRRFDQDLSTSAVQLGKALQDPVGGVVALRRVGVSFTSDQKKLIEQLVRTGNVLGAQKEILKEVRVETGNAAAAYGKTMAGQLEILQGSLTNLAGELANVLNPQVKRLTSRFNEFLANPENKKKIIDGFATSVHGLGLAFGGASDAIGKAVGAYKDFRSAFGSGRGGPGNLKQLLFGSSLDVYRFFREAAKNVAGPINSALGGGGRFDPFGLLTPAGTAGPTGKPGRFMAPGTLGPARLAAGTAAPPTLPRTFSLPGFVSGTGAGPRTVSGLPGHIGGVRAATIPPHVGGAGDALGFQVQARLALGLARATALGQAVRPWLIRMRESIKKALAAGFMSVQAQTDAYDALTSVNEQLRQTAKKQADDYRHQRARAVRLAQTQGAAYQFANARGTVINIENFHSAAANPRALEDQLTKRARARPQVRRGAR